MEQFASGWKRNYYGKADVTVYRLRRDGAGGISDCPVFGASLKMLIYGDAFWRTYTAGDNEGLIATDSMKNFIERETLNYSGPDLEDCCRFLAAKFLKTYPHVEGIQMSATELPYSPLAGDKSAYIPRGPERSTAQIEMNRSGIVQIVSGICGFKLLRLKGSAFRGFLRDAYTTLPESSNRPLQMWLDLQWLYTSRGAAFSGGKVAGAVRQMVHDVFRTIDSGSIQQVMYQIASKIIRDVPVIEEVHLEANNRTWETVEELEDLGVYAEGRRPYGCLGLRLARSDNGDHHARSR